MSRYEDVGVGLIAASILLTVAAVVAVPFSVDVANALIMMAFGAAGVSATWAFLLLAVLW